MKTFKSLIALILFSVVFTSFSSCLVVRTTEGNNGRHRGWYKNSNNPHNPNTTNPGNGNNGNGNGHGHGKKNK
ncbi:MAG: hypothetical protein H7141_07035 [Burkholderiales bacterium]|nr:hypothetical protein [Bacteroidia bacterium]